MLKDVADLFREEGVRAREALESLKPRALDALGLALGSAPAGSTHRRYQHAREQVLPLLLRLEDEGERYAALDDVAAALSLRKGDLRKVLAAMEEGERRNEAQKKAGESELEPLPEDAEKLVANTGVLDRYVEDAAAIHGVVGERPVLKLQTLVAVGAQLAPYPNGKPAGANLIITAEPGRGKNHICDAVTSLLPKEFCLPFESASAKSLFYRAEQDPTILNHVWIYPNEAEATDKLVEMFRPLLSGGKASHLTVNKDAEGRNAAQELYVEGPASITIPTVRNKLDVQLQTRMLVAELADYEGRVAAHSRAASRLLLPGYAAEDHGPKVRAWHAGLGSLTEVRRVVFDLEHEGFCFDSDGVSHGARLWGNLLGLMLAHAWLEQNNREITDLPNGERAVVAVPEDYEAAYEIFKVTCERSIVNLSDTHRKVLGAVYELNQESTLADGFSLREIAEKAGVHHSTVGHHKTYLTKSAKLLREVEGEGLNLVADADPSWWQKDDLLVGFPRPEQVWKWWDETFHLAAETARQNRHHGGKASDPLGNEQRGVGHLTRQEAAADRHLANGSVSGERAALSDDMPDSENPVGAPDTNGRGLVSGVSGGFEDDGQETFNNKREVFTI